MERDRDDAIHVYFVDIRSIVDVKDYNIQLNTKLLDAMKANSVYRIELIAEEPDMPLLMGLLNYVIFYTNKAVHAILGDRITTKELQDAVKLFPDFLGGRWNWMYIGKNKELAEKFGIRSGVDGDFN